ncbi:leucine-rich repeats and immunoglobulin-like domains protein 3 [Siphateles boraxobius]|uniref:leucine-rich repeats and immunoglobulin-like domains protein 3 n=1 Tax=Siphateles boraxobius TaxID=180520 RepID=UPI004062B8D8
MPQPARAVSFALLVFHLTGFKALHGDSEPDPDPCPSVCSCVGSLADCSALKHGMISERLPARIRRLDLSHNKLRTFPEALFSSLPHLSEIKLNNNDFESIPDLGPDAGNLSCLILANNKISRISSDRLGSLVALETLDLSNNNIMEVRAGAFPPLPLKNLLMNNNRISTLEHGCFSNLSNSLLVLKLNKNRLSSVPPKIFPLPHLQTLELSRNRVRRVEGLAFHGLHGLRSLKIQRNGITRLMDGAFWGLNNMEVLQLEHNNLTEVSKGWLYGLLTLQKLHLSHNTIIRIRADAWEFCQKLSELDLNWNQLTRLEEGSFVGLSVLEQLHIGNNRVSFIADGAFRGLANLQTLDLKCNEISWTIEDMNGPFSALDNLRKLFLQGNRIRSVTRKSFAGLDELEQLDLSNNAIMSLQANAFSQMKKLTELLLNTSSLLCDCQLKWFSPWVAEHAFLPLVNASCAHPHLLKGRSVFSVAQDEFVCDDFPKPQITVQPETQSAIKGTNVTFVCSAASSSDSPMTFAWKKDNEVLNDAEIHNQAHLRSQVSEVTEVTEYTTTLQMRTVDFSSEGRYQCVISNHFGSSYSSKAKLTVNMLPYFTKMPMDLTIRAGATARLECAASGHPSPQIAWQKDGGTDFPAARERRMHVMPRDDVFFMVDVKTEDIGVYSCTAQNTAGAVSANATLTVLETPSFLRPLMDRSVATGETAVLQCIAGGSPAPRLNWTKDDSPLLVTERHFFAAGNQLLIIVDAAEGDAGTYTCEMSNPLGTERGNVRLAIIPNPNCDPGVGIGSAAGRGSEDDGWTTVGIVIIAVVCCVVGTSLVWVVIIYHTRRRNEDCSVTNTDETNLPADIPSYLSSQGTLAERQDGFIASESDSHQYISSSIGGFYMPTKDMNSLCQLDTGSDADMEAIDPMLCRYQGPVGSLRRYSPDPPESYTDPRLVCSESYGRNREFYTCSSALEPFDHMMTMLSTDTECVEECVRGECVLGSPGSYMGTFGKAWRPHPGVVLQENPYTGTHPDPAGTHPDLDVYETPFDNRTMFPAS